MSIDLNPYRAGARLGDEPASLSDGTVDELPRWRRWLRFLAVAKFAEAFLEIVLIAGSLWFLVHLGFPALERALANQRSKAYLVERLLAVPALAALSVWIGRGLIGARKPAIVVQLIVSVVVLSWVLLGLSTDLIDVQIAVEMFSASPVFGAFNVAFYLTKLCAGVGHAAIAIFLFRVRNQVLDGSRDSVANRSGAEFGLLSIVLAAAAAIVLTIGTIAATHSMVLYAIM